MTPDSTIYIQWADTVTLRPASNVLLGPFNFEAISSSNRTRNKFSGVHWRDLYDICTKCGILPPTTGSLTFNASGALQTTSRCCKQENPLLALYEEEGRVYYSITNTMTTQTQPTIIIFDQSTFKRE